MFFKDRAEDNKINYWWHIKLSVYLLRKSKSQYFSKIDGKNVTPNNI